MNTENGKNRFPPQTVAHDVGEFAHDIVTLAELQFELLKVDVADSLKRMLVPAVLFTGGAIVLLGSIPIALTALACLLVYAGASYGLAFLLTTFVGLLIAGGLTFAGWKTLSRVTSVFDRSRGEFSRNVRWVKKMLTSKRRDRQQSSLN